MALRDILPQPNAPREVSRGRCKTYLGSMFKLNNISTVSALAPLVFVLHFLEEAPTFVEWFNAHVSRGITSELFWTVNLSALVITLTLVLVEWVSRSGLSLSLILFWLTFLMPANAILHGAGALVDGQYVPGLVTAVFLYLPYYSWLITAAVRSGRVRIPGLIVGATLASLPMLIHGYLIIFRGSRLF